MPVMIGFRSASDHNGEGRFAVQLEGVTIWRGGDVEQANSVARRAARTARAAGRYEDVFEIWDLEGEDE